MQLIAQNEFNLKKGKREFFYIKLNKDELERLKNKLYVVKQLGVKYKIFEELEKLLE